jgi:hypothetical protein
MSVTDGQPANEDTFNDAFASKSADNVLAGKQTFEDRVTREAGSVMGATPHTFTNGQIATDLTGETFDSATWRAVLIKFHLYRGTTVYTFGWIGLFWDGSAWQMKAGNYFGSGLHGVTFSKSGTTTAQLKLAADSGAGDGEVLFEKTYVPA